jgi:hypothetical protein
VPFPYLDVDDVKVTVDGEPVAVTWNNSSVLNISPAPIVGAIVYIQRRTNSNALLVDFTDGSTLSEKQLDLMAQQNFYLAQEAYTSKSVGNIVRNYFANSYKEMVSFFAKEQKISKEDLNEIINLIEKREDK